MIYKILFCRYFIRFFNNKHFLWRLYAILIVSEDCNFTRLNSMHSIKKLSGFALLETAISAVVVSGYLMSYHAQENNKQLVNDAINYSKPSQIAVTKYFEENGVLPTNNSQIHLPNDNYSGVANLKIDEFGQIVITLSDSEVMNSRGLSNKTIILEPNISQGSINWTCNSGSLDNKYRPQNCYKKENYNNVEESETLDYLESTNYL